MDSGCNLAQVVFIKQLLRYLHDVLEVDENCGLVALNHVVDLGQVVPEDDSARGRMESNDQRTHAERGSTKLFSKKIQKFKIQNSKNWFGPLTDAVSW